MYNDAVGQCFCLVIECLIKQTTTKSDDIRHFEYKQTCKNFSWFIPFFKQYLSLNSYIQEGVINQPKTEHNLNILNNWAN